MIEPGLTVPARRTLIVHIGASKAGSTSIQYLLAVLAPHLARRGILVPRADSGHHHNLLLELAGRWTVDPRRAGWREVEAEIAVSRAPRVVLSSEIFTDEALGGAPAVERLRALAVRTGVAVRPVAYLRPQTERLESWYAEQVRHGRMTLPFEAFLAETLARPAGGPLDYETMLEPWRAAFGGALAVFAMERGRPAQGLLAHFLEVIGAADAELLGRLARLRPPRANVRVGAGELEVRRRVADALRGRPEPEVRRAMRRLDRLGAVLGSDPPFAGLDATGAAAVAARFAPSNARLARALGLGGPLFRASPSSGGRRPNGVDWADFAATDRRAVGAWVQRRTGVRLATGGPDDPGGGLSAARARMIRFYARALVRLPARWRQAAAVRHPYLLRVWLNQTLMGRWR